MIADWSVVCWGGGEHGQIGRGSLCNTIGSSEGATKSLDNIPPDELYQLACGASHTICVSTGWL